MPIVTVDIQPAIIKWALCQTKEEQLGEKVNESHKRWLDDTKNQLSVK